MYITFTFIHSFIHSRGGCDVVKIPQGQQWNSQTHLLDCLSVCLSGTNNPVHHVKTHQHALSYADSDLQKVVFSSSKFSPLKKSQINNKIFKNNSTKIKNPIATAEK